MQKRYNTTTFKVKHMAQEITIEDLARMINGMDQRISSDLKGMKQDIYDIKEVQGRIEDKLSNVAYRFELNALEKRVSALES